MAFKEPDNEARGRHADDPAKIPAKGWRDILLRIKDQMAANHLSITAAGIAYFAFLAIFPGLAALVSLYGLFSDPMSVQQQLATVQSIMPQEAYTIIENQLQIIATQPQSSLGLGSIGGLLRLHRPPGRHPERRDGTSDDGGQHQGNTKTTR